MISKRFSSGADKIEPEIIPLEPVSTSTPASNDEASSSESGHEEEEAPKDVTW